MTVFSTKKPCSSPENPEKIKIWKYMNLEKFLYLLQNKKLYMASIYTLFKKFDKLEGKLYPETKQYIIEDGKSMTIELERRYGVPVRDVTAKTNKILVDNLVHNTFASCWHIGENDTPCMWAIYASRKLGIVIQSTYKRLHDALDTNHKICLGFVKYQTPPKKNLLNQYEHFLHKREPYRFENELRVLITNNNKERYHPHLDISVNLDELLENVYIKPGTKESYRKSISELMRKYCINRLVLPSSLEPHYTENR